MSEQKELYAIKFDNGKYCSINCQYVEGYNEISMMLSSEIKLANHYDSIEDIEDELMGVIKHLDIKSNSIHETVFKIWDRDEKKRIYGKITEFVRFKYTIEILETIKTSY